jgi:Fe-S-cluster containining protein
MKCLRCGYCCINYDVIIVDNPKLGIVESNLKHKPSGIKCQHLIGNAPGKYSCTIHNEKWYKETPCFAFSQIESDINSPCRIGENVLKNLKGRENMKF